MELMSANVPPMQSASRFAVPPSARAPQRVLVVQPNPLLAQLLRAMLSPMACHLSQASSVAEATAWLESHRPALMLVDDALPDGTLWDVIHAARHIHAPAHGSALVQPTITVMALGDGTDALRAHNDQGASDLEAPWRFLVHPKPFCVDTLRRLVQQCLTAAQAPPVVGPDAPALQAQDDRFAAAWSGSLAADAWGGSENHVDAATKVAAPAPMQPIAQIDRRTPSAPPIWWR